MQDKLKQQNLTIEDHMAQQLCSYHIGLEGVDESTKPFKYVMTSTGVMRVMKNSIGIFVAKVDKIQGLPDIKEGVILNVPKVPYYLFQQTIAFFREVMRKKNNAEAMLQFYYDKENDKYILHCPEQTVSGASVKFTRNEELDKQYILVMDIHSHNSMRAFFSSVDDADEKETRIFGVVGHLNQSNPMWKFRISVGGVYKEIDLFDIFERPFPEASFPEEWLNKCKVVATNYRQAYAIGKTVGKTGGTTRGTTYVGGQVVKQSNTFRPSAGGYYTATSKYGNKYSSSISSQSYYDLIGFDEDFDEVEGYNVYGVPTYEEVDCELEKDPMNNFTDVSSKVNTYSIVEDIYTMTSEERVELVKELLLAYPEEVAKAIYDESALDDIQREILKIAAKEETYA